MSSDLYPSRLHQLVASRRANVVAFAWGFAEATLFFIVPDVWLTFCALYRIRSGLRSIPWCLLGALLGGVVCYGAGRVAPEATFQLLAYIPGINQPMIEQAKAESEQRGVAAVLSAPWRGVPYKIYAAEAGRRGESLLSFLLLSVPARLERFLPLVLVVVAIRWLGHRSIDQHPWPWFAVYLAFWTIGYLLYFFLIV